MDSDSAERTIRYEVSDRIALITLDRPPANAFSSAMYRRLSDIADRLAADETVHAAIFTAAPGPIFCGGADVKELATLDGAGRAAFFDVSGETRRKFQAIPVPVIAAIGGRCAGAGVAYATRCDHRIAAEEAGFSMPEIDIGSVAGGGVDLMSVGVPSGALRMMLFSAGRCSAREALAVHLVDEVVPAQRLMEVARERAALIAAKPRHALVAMKRAIGAMSHNPAWSEENLMATQRMSVEMADRAETRAALDRLAGKPPPERSGR